MKKPLEALIAVARGETPAELVIKNAQVWSTFSGSFIPGDVAVHQGYIAGVGDYSGQEAIDAKGKYLIPGFIDAHVHIESSMTAPSRFAGALVRAGVTTVIADPHEIANVAGVKGIEYILRASEDIPLRVFVMLPSCVPATPLEDSAATLLADDLAPLLEHPRVMGLGEMMNYPGVLHRDLDVMRKLHMAGTRRIDGHGPGLWGKDLSAYAAAGISSDHECTTSEEAQERLARGIALMLRQGSAAANLLSLLPAVTPENETWCMFATDDRNLHDLLAEGSINHMVRLALGAGQPLRRVLDMACLNAARHFGLRDQGIIAPGFRADMALYPDLESWWPELVLKDGCPALRDGKFVWPSAQGTASAHVDDTALRSTVHLASVTREQLAIPAKGRKARVIGVLPGQIVTEELQLEVPVHNGCFVADTGQDILKLSVWERHRNTGRVGMGLVRGMGLARGAIGSTVAHDSHHLIAVGAADDDILAVVKALAEMGGGLAVAENGKITGTLPLPLGGLLSDQPLENVSENLAALQALVRRLGIPEGYDPFMTLAFFSLPVIPALKLTYAGLVDVTRFAFVPVDAG